MTRRTQLDSDLCSLCSQAPPRPQPHPPPSALRPSARSSSFSPRQEASYTFDREMFWLRIQLSHCPDQHRSIVQWVHFVHFLITHNTTHSLPLKISYSKDSKIVVLELLLVCLTRFRIDLHTTRRLTCRQAK